MGVEKKIQLPKDLILEMYETMTMQQIAEECGVSLKTLQRRFREWGVLSKGDKTRVVPKPKENKKKALPPYTNKDDFERVYKELKSLVLVAKHYNIGFSTAYQWKVKHKIATVKGVSEIGKAKLNKDKPWANQSLLEEMYSQYSSPQLAKMWGCDPSTICDWLKRFNIPIKTTSEQWKRESKNSKVVLGESINIEELQLIKTRLHSNLAKKIKDKVGECQCCGFNEVLDLHHINEDATDNRPENHIVLCPNCHAKIHRLDKTVQELCPNYKPWSEYQ